MHVYALAETQVGEVIEREQLDKQQNIPVGGEKRTLLPIQYLKLNKGRVPPPKKKSKCQFFPIRYTVLHNE